MEVLSYKTFRELEKNLETAEVVKGVVHKSAADIAELELLFFFQKFVQKVKFQSFAFNKFSILGICKA